MHRNNDKTTFKKRRGKLTRNDQSHNKRILEIGTHRESIRLDITGWKGDPQRIMQKVSFWPCEQMIYAHVGRYIIYLNCAID